MFYGITFAYVPVQHSLINIPTTPAHSWSVFVIPA